VDDAGSQHTADAGEIRAVVKQCVDERAARMASGRMDDETRRFVDDDELGILVEHDERNRLGQDLEWLRRRNADLDRVAFLHPQRLRRDRAADRDVTVFDQALDLRSRQVRKRTCDDRVEASPRLLRGDDELVRLAALVVVYQIFDLTWPFDLVSTSTIARS
jgi:hypothetical protein